MLTSLLLTQKEILLPSSIHLLLTNHITALIIINASSKQLRSARLHRKQALFPTLQGKASVCYKTNQIRGEGGKRRDIAQRSVTLNDISVVMVKPWVMTGSSSVVRPFQQSSSMQRQPDRRTCLYISTEEFPASWPAALHKETNSTWGRVAARSTSACASMFQEHAMNCYQRRENLIPPADIREPITSSH